MIKVFTLNENKKIELTKEELQKLLDESYWDGYTNGSVQKSWTYTSPFYWENPFTCSNTTTSSIKIETEDNK